MTAVELVRLILRLLRPLFDRAVRDGILEGTFAEVATELLTALFGQGFEVLSPRRVRIPRELVEGAILTEQLDQLVAFQALWEEAMRDSFDDALRRSRAKRRTTEEQLADVRIVGERFGLLAGLSAPLAFLYLFLLVVQEWEHFNRRAHTETPVGQVWPYFRYRTIGDDKVRGNHDALEGFVAASSWEGWAFVQPPNGWNCRCRLLPVDWLDAQALGFAGTLPLGEQHLRDFYRLGGPDEKFPKEDFVVL